MAEVEAFLTKATVAVDAAIRAANKGKACSNSVMAGINEAMKQLANFKCLEVKGLRDELTECKTKVTELTKVIENKDTVITELQEENIELQNQTDSSNQYNRRDNFKITGIPYRENENLIDVVKSVTNHIGMEIQEQDISDIHRLPSLTETNGIKTPGIIVRVNRRRVKYGVMDNKKQLRSRPHPEYPNVGIYEDLTPLRSRMLYALRNRKNEQGTNTFKYTWSKEGRIFCRTEEQAKPAGHGQKQPKPGIVNTPRDLIKLGFTEQEVKAIVSNKRK